MASETVKTTNMNEVDLRFSAQTNGFDPPSKANSLVRGNRPDNWAPIREEPAYSRRRLKVVCIGAGMGGITFAHKVRHEYKLDDVIDFVIYEKNPDVGGTWYENKYPGVAW